MSRLYFIQNNAIVGHVDKLHDQYTVMHDRPFVTDLTGTIDYVRSSLQGIRFTQSRRRFVVSDPWMKYIEKMASYDFSEILVKPAVCFDCEWHSQTQKMTEAAFVLPNGRVLWEYTGNFRKEHYVQIQAYLDQYLLVGCDLRGDFLTLQRNAKSLRVSLRCPFLHLNIQAISAMEQHEEEIYKGRTLRDLVRHYGIAATGLHHALTDTKIIAQIYRMQCKSFASPDALLRQYIRKYYQVTP